MLISVTDSHLTYHCCELPGRLNIVISRQKSFPLDPGVIRANSLQNALILAVQKRHQVFVIGGAKFLRDALSLADVVYETVVHAELQGDTFVEAFEFRNWSSELIEEHPADSLHLFAFSIYRHSRSI